MRKIWTAIAGLMLILTGTGLTWGWNEPKLLDQVGDNESATPNLLENEETTPEDDRLKIGAGRPWQAPAYGAQTGALGWTEGLFDVPPGLRDRVDFWIDIYTKYSTDQGIIHDSEHVKIVYATVDFTDIASDKNLTESAKRKARKRRVENKKNEIKERLRKLARVKNADPSAMPDELDTEDQRLWLMFKNVTEPDRFTRATHRKRIRFQLGQRDRFMQGIYYSGRYLPEMERIFREAGLPVELTRLPFVESSFNVKARSRVGASGIWQFMRYTGRKYMRINYALDERNDPIKATHAAAKFMRLNYNMLGKWPLAITAYNHGAAGVRRMVQRYGTDDIVELADERHGRFKFASANFYATFLAAVEVEKNAPRYFGKVLWDSPMRSKELEIGRKRINRSMLVSWFDGDKEKAADWNPHLSRAFWLGHATLTTKDFVRIPEERYEVALQNLETMRTVAKEDSADMNVYFINQGETLSEIAAHLGVPLRSLIEVNGIENPRRLMPGQKLLVPKK